MIMTSSEPRLLDYLSHIKQAIDNINNDTSELDFIEFEQNPTIQRSVIFSFIIIGEASTKISQKYPSFIEDNPHIAWQAMKGMRNHLAHGYFSINLKVLWRTISIELPTLATQINTLIESHD